MKKDKNWLKEQINYLKEAVGKPAINDFSRGLNDAYETLESLINQLDEPELPVIPQFVADWIEEAKGRHHSLYQAMNEYCTADMNQWIKGFFHSDTFARAWLDGYTIEKEQMYYVRENNYLLCKYNNEVIDYVEAAEREITDLIELKLTEKEIKDYDERYWAFAEEIKK